MDFLHNDLGQLDGGAIVEVTLDRAANVRLMDSSNFSSYRRGAGHRSWGGEAIRSPVRLAVPHAAHWHVAIDLGGRSGSIRTGVRVLRR